MRIEERFTVPFPCERVWAFLHDTEAVVRCLPGAELTETGADGRVAGRFSVKLGPIAATFSGNAEVAFDEAAHKGEIAGSGSDRRSGSRARAAVSFALVDDNAGTRVDILADYSLAGTLAQFNRGGIVRDVAQRLTAQFAETLQIALAAVTPTPAPVDAGKLLARVIWGRLRRWLCALFGRD
jgi:carbon monoxide dehydrogenase subunit G